MPGREASRAAAVCRRWAAAVGSEKHWEAQCVRTWGLTQPRDADLEPASFRCRQAPVPAPLWTKSAFQGPEGSRWAVLGILLIQSDVI